MSHTSFLAVVASALGLAWFGIGLAVWPAESHAATCTDAPEYVLEAGGACGLPGDDNDDGFIDEDESGWDCRTMGNRRCG